MTALLFLKDLTEGYLIVTILGVLTFEFTFDREFPFYILRGLLCSLLSLITTVLSCLALPLLLRKLPRKLLIVLVLLIGEKDSLDCMDATEFD